MTLEQKSEVVINPNDLYEIDGQIYLVSNGDYDGVPATLQSIDSNGKSTIITPAAKITKGHDGLIYCVNSSFDANCEVIRDLDVSENISSPLYQ